VAVRASAGTGSDYVYLGRKLIAKLEQGVSSNVPDPVTSVTAPSTSSSGALTVSWSSSTYALSYTLQQQLSGGSWTTVYSGEAPSKALTESTGGSYVFRVAACNAVGCSAYTASGTTTVAPQTASTLTVPSGINTTGSYGVSWTAISGATSDTLQEQLNGGSWSASYSGSLTSQGYSGKTNGSWGYRVQACNAGGCSAWSATQSVTVFLPPPAPASITAPATSSGSLTVSWAGASTATSYTLQHQKDGSAWSSLYSGSATSEVVTETATGSYAYRVAACNTSGCSAYNTSSAVTVTIPPSSAPTLSVPAGTNVTGSYSVSWTAISGATSYTLQEQLNGGSWSASYSGSLTSQGYSGKGNGTYGYQVQACNAGGCSGWSATQSITVFLPPPAPASITAPATSSGSLTVSWAGASTATSYTLQHQKDGSAWSSLYSGSATSEVVTETATGSYAYRVAACNTSGCSAYNTSSAVTVTIPPSSAPTLSVPAGTNVTGSYSVSWTAISGATSYTLQEQLNGGSWSASYSGSLTSQGYSGKGNGTYGYQVQACNAGGCSGWSATTTVTVDGSPVVPTGLNVTVQNTSTGLYEVTWNSAVRAATYELDESAGDAYTMTHVATYQTTGTSKAFSRNNTNSYFAYKVRACNSFGCSGWGGTVTVHINSTGSGCPPTGCGNQL